MLNSSLQAKTGKTPSEVYNNELIPVHGNPYYKRVDGPITDKQKETLKKLTPDTIKKSSFAGKKIKSILTTAPGNSAPIGGVKTILEDESWFAIRPSGTEPIMKFYIESFGGESLWNQIKEEASQFIFG